MFWNKKTTKEEILTKEGILTKEEMLVRDQTTAEHLTSRLLIVDDIVIYRSFNFTNSNSISSIKDCIEVRLSNEEDDWINDKNYKYVLHLKGLGLFAFYTKEKADECLIKFIKFINNNDTL